MTLDSIIAHYQADTLSNLGDASLYRAQDQVALLYDWRRAHPSHPTQAIPDCAILRHIENYIRNLLRNRYGCND